MVDDGRVDEILFDYYGAGRFNSAPDTHLLGSLTKASTQLAGKIGIIYEAQIRFKASQALIALAVVNTAHTSMASRRNWLTDPFQMRYLCQNIV